MCVCARACVCVWGGGRLSFPLQCAVLSAGGVIEFDESLRSGVVVGGGG